MPALALLLAAPLTGSALAGGAAGATVGGDDSSQRAPATVKVVADDLPDGPLPSIAWADHVTKKLVRPGRRSLTLTTTDNSVSDLRRAHGGYLYTEQEPWQRNNKQRTFIKFISDSGKKHKLRTVTGRSRIETSLWFSVVSRNGRTVALTDGNRTIDVLRIRDGKRLGHWVLPKKSWLAAVALTKTDVWFHTRRGGDLWTANLRTKKVRAWDRRASRNDPGMDSMSDDTPAPAINLATGRLAVQEGRHTAIVRKSDKKRLWTTRRWEHVVSWSPDNKLVVTADRPKSEWLYQVTAGRLRIRDARSGKIRLTLTGIFNVQWARHGLPAWEDSHTLLLKAYSEWRSEPEDGPYPVGGESIRCSVTKKACEKIPDFDIDDVQDLVVRRSA
ncbi:hypothetical protein ASG90_11685 [Nocardioides sp. Soil797]|nr:hypothetical protein ASG90_11685 [Nocardioides sp. Soil797]